MDENNESNEDVVLVATEHARHAAEARARAESHGYSPILSYRLSLGVDAQTSPGSAGADTRVFPNYAVGLALNLPLWDGGAASAGEARALAEASELKATAEATRQMHKYRRAQSEAQRAHAARLVALTSRAARMAEERIQQLEDTTSVGASYQDQLEAARVECNRVHAEALRARAMAVQLALIE